MRETLQKWLVKKYSAVSFDVFDTLVERETSIPTDVFRLAAAQVLGSAVAERFRQDRVEAERIAREKRADSEVVLCEIYDELKEKYGEKTRKLMCAEVKEELNVCYPKERNAAWFQQCMDEGKKVYLVSDMYLPTEIIEKILTCCGIEGYEKLYVSGACRKNKLTGELFRIMLGENGLDAGQVLHIGDSVRADFLGARKAGIRSVWIPRKHKNIR